MTIRTDDLPSLRRPAIAGPGFALIVLAVAAPVAAAPTHVLCVVRLTDVEGLADGDLDPSLALEARKGGMGEVRTVPGTSKGCPVVDGDRLTLILGGTPSIVVESPEGGRWPLDVDGVDEPDRAQDVARRVVALFGRMPEMRRVPIVASDLPAWATPDATMRTSAGRAGSAVQGYVAATGAYRYEAAASRHAGVASLEGGVSLFRERLLAGLVVAWQPARSAAARSIRTRVEATETGFRLRGGLAIGPAWLRAGVGAGAEWRRLKVRIPSRTDELRASGWVPTAAGEIEVAFRFGPILRIALATTIAGRLAWTDYRYRGTGVYDGPRWTVDTALRIGAVFPKASE